MFNTATEYHRTVVSPRSSPGEGGKSVSINLYCMGRCWCWGGVWEREEGRVPAGSQVGGAFVRGGRKGLPGRTLPPGWPAVGGGRLVARRRHRTADMERRPLTVISTAWWWEGEGVR